MHRACAYIVLARDWARLGDYEAGWFAQPALLVLKGGWTLKAASTSGFGSGRGMSAPAGVLRRDFDAAQQAGDLNYAALPDTS